MDLVTDPYELTTAATDALMAGLAVAAIVYLRRFRTTHPWKAGVWMGAFAALVVAAVAGTVLHAFVISEQTYWVLDQVLYLSLGLMLSLFVVGVVFDAWSRDASRRMLPVMVGLSLTFYGITLAFDGLFMIFVLYEVALLLFALGTYGVLAARGQTGAAWMALGVLVTMVAAGIQATGTVRVTLIWPFDHNGVFHLVQMPGLVFLLLGLRAGMRPAVPAARAAA